MIFEDELDRLSFADCFWDSVLAFELNCIVAVQVGTHYHALFECGRDQLSDAMQKLNGSHARRFNVRHGRHGHLFGDRFSTWVPESERHLEATVPYILWNPVRAGLCSHPSDWDGAGSSPSERNSHGPTSSRPTPVPVPWDRRWNVPGRDSGWHA